MTEVYTQEVMFWGLRGNYGELWKNSGRQNMCPFVGIQMDFIYLG